MSASHRVPHRRNMVSVAEAEEIRKQLGLEMAEFSRRLGWGEKSYSAMVKQGQCTKTTLMAARALAKEPVNGAKQQFILELDGMTATIRPMPDFDKAQRLLFNNVVYILIPEG